MRYGADNGTPTASDERRPVFVHFLEREFLRMIPPGSAPTTTEALTRLARFALLLSAGPIVVPAPGPFETEDAATVVAALEPAVDAGLVEFLGGGEDVHVFVERKTEHFPGGPYDGCAELLVRTMGSAWRVKGNSTDADLLAGWGRSGANGRHPLGALIERSPRHALVEQEVLGLPDRLEGRALVASHLLDALPRDVGQRVNATDITKLRHHLASGWYWSYTRDRPVAVVDCSGLPDAKALVPETVEKLDMRRTAAMLDLLALTGPLLDRLTMASLAAVAGSPAWTAFADEVARRRRQGRGWVAKDLVALRGLRRSVDRMRDARDNVLERRLQDVVERAVVELGALEWQVGARRSPLVSLRYIRNAAIRQLNSADTMFVTPPSEKPPSDAEEAP